MTGIFTDQQRDHLLVNLQADNDIQEAIIILLLSHLARSESDPMAFLRGLSQELHDIANHVSVDPSQDFSVRFHEAHRTKVDQLLQAAAHRVSKGN